MRRSPCLLETPPTCLPHSKPSLTTPSSVLQTCACCSRSIGGEGSNRKAPNAGVSSTTLCERAGGSTPLTVATVKAVVKRQWHEPLVLELIERNGGKDPERIIEEHADRLRKRAGQQTLPVKPHLIASLLGIRRRRGEHDFAGRIY